MTRRVKHSIVLISLISMFVWMIPMAVSAEDGESTFAFSQDSYTVTMDERYVYLTFANGEVDLKDVKSSNSEVAEVNDYGDTQVELYLWEEGTVTITATDRDGHVAKCMVVVKPKVLKMEQDRYDYTEYDPEDGEIKICTTGAAIDRATSADLRIVSVECDDNSDPYTSLILTPKAAGETTITVRDEHGQSIKVPVSFTQKFVDQYNYLELLKKCSPTIVYGDAYANLELWDINAPGRISMTITIDGVEYSNTVRDQDSDYLDLYVTKLPKLKAGQVYTYKLIGGEVSVEGEGTVQPIHVTREDLYAYESYTYIGKPRYPDLVPEFEIFGDDKHPAKGVDYTVTYSNNKNVGTATAKYVFKGNYTGSPTVTFKILPKGTSIAKLTPKSKAMTVKWKKQATQTSGYQVRYSLKSSMGSAKTVTVKGTSKTSTTIKKLKAKKKYYVQVRTYKTVSGKKYYSSWSSKKAVRTK